MEISDHRSIASDIEVDLSPIYDAIDKWHWLLDEQYIGGRPGFDELIHDPMCNLSPEYHKGKSPEEVVRVKAYGCDRRCLETWKEKQRLLSIELAKKRSYLD
jgi:hypothetical protein